MNSFYLLHLTKGARLCPGHVSCGGVWCLPQVVMNEGHQESTIAMAEFDKKCTTLD